jgi:hypothetical protein
VQVVHGQQHWPTQRQVGGQPVQPVQRRKGGIRRVLAGSDVRFLEQGQCQLRRATGQLGALLDRSTGQQRLEQLADDAEGELLLQLPRAGGQHLKARRPGGGERHANQAGLAHAGTALDHQQSPGAAARAGQELLDRGDLGLALEQRGLRRKRSGRRHGTPTVIVEGRRPQRLGQELGAAPNASGSALAHDRPTRSKRGGTCAPLPGSRRRGSRSCGSQSWSGSCSCPRLAPRPARRPRRPGPARTSPDRGDRDGWSTSAGEPSRWSPPTTRTPSAPPSLRPGSASQAGRRVAPAGHEQARSPAGLGRLAALLVLSGCTSAMTGSTTAGRSSAAAPSTGPASARPGRVRLHGRVALASDRRRNVDLYLLELPAGRLRRLTSSPAADLSPTRAPDGWPSAPTATATTRSTS